MTIGQLAVRAMVNIETVRYYERRGLLPEPARTESGYRQYTSDAIARLRFIRQAQRLGFTLREIGELLALRVRHEGTCAAVGRRTHEKIALVRQKIRELQVIERSLTCLAAACAARHRTDDCPVLNALDEAETIPDA